MARKTKKEMSSYYCVVSTNKTKTGTFISAVTRLQDWILPFNRYDKSSETYYDYFCDREQALTFAKLLRG